MYLLREFIYFYTLCVKNWPPKEIDISFPYRYRRVGGGNKIKESSCVYWENAKNASIFSLFQMTPWNCVVLFLEVMLAKFFHTFFVHCDLLMRRLDWAQP